MKYKEYISGEKVVVNDPEELSNGYYFEKDKDYLWFLCVWIDEYEIKQITYQGVKHDIEKDSTTADDYAMNNEGIFYKATPLKQILEGL
jgi:hypothetical protein